MVKRSTILGLITFAACLILLVALNYYVCNKVFCDTCEFNDQNILYKAFYRNEDGIGYYYTEPTLANYIMVLLLSAGLGRLVAMR